VKTDVYPLQGLKEYCQPKLRKTLSMQSSKSSNSNLTGSSYTSPRARRSAR
jgi:hypothetical protein